MTHANYWPRYLDYGSYSKFLAPDYLGKQISHQVLDKEFEHYSINVLCFGGI